jgi:hypothetical protein
MRSPKHGANRRNFNGNAPVTTYERVVAAAIKVLQLEEERFDAFEIVGRIVRRAEKKEITVTSREFFKLVEIADQQIVFTPTVFKPEHWSAERIWTPKPTKPRGKQSAEHRKKIKAGVRRELAARKREIV